jgi:hypothetical protein
MAVSAFTPLCGHHGKLCLSDEWPSIEVIGSSDSKAGSSIAREHLRPRPARFIGDACSELDPAVSAPEVDLFLTSHVSR